MPDCIPKSAPCESTAAMSGSGTGAIIQLQAGETAKDIPNTREMKRPARSARRRSQDVPSRQDDLFCSDQRRDAQRRERRRGGWNAHSPRRKFNIPMCRSQENRTTATADDGSRRAKIDEAG